MFIKKLTHSPKLFNSILHNRTYMSTSKKLKIALCQLQVGSDKQQNVQRAIKSIREAAKQGAELIVLPECFNSPYGTQYFEQYAEPFDKSETLAEISKISKECNVQIIAGSIPTREDSKLYNTSTVWSNGDLIATHRKVHLFDINIPGKISFQESKVLSPGNKLTTFDSKIGKVGLGICFDIRFTEMALLYQRMGCNLLCYPGAFNMTTGPLHWELLAKSRAIDNQVFVCLCSPARDENASYVAWGHSMIVDPFGEKIAEADHTEQTIFGEIDLAKLEEIRANLPVIKNKRYDLYDVIQKSE